MTHLKDRKWTEYDKDFLRKSYPDKGAGYCSEKLGRSAYAIRRMANILKIASNYLRARYGEDNFRLVVAKSKSISEVLRYLGVRKSDKVVKKYIKKYKVDISHFWEKSGGSRIKKRPLAEILVKDNFTDSSSGIKDRLYKEGIKKRECELCGQGEMWKGKKMSLILDHKNGIHTDWRLINLQIVCPNCNATLDTYCRGIKPRKAKVADGRKARKCKSVFWNRKIVNRPSLKELKDDVSKMSYVAVGKKYGVSDNAIRKWFSSYGIKPPKKINKKNGSKR